MTLWKLTNQEKEDRSRAQITETAEGEDVELYMQTASKEGTEPLSYFYNSPRLAIIRRQRKCFWMLLDFASLLWGSQFPFFIGFLMLKTVSWFSDVFIGFLMLEFLVLK